MVLSSSAARPPRQHQGVVHGSRGVEILPARSTVIGIFVVIGILCEQVQLAASARDSYSASKGVKKKELRSEMDIQKAAASDIKVELSSEDGSPASI